MSLDGRRRRVTRRAAVGSVGSMRAAMTAFAMATAHLERAAADTGRHWATDRGEGSPRVVAGMRIQVGSGAAVLGRTCGGHSTPRAEGPPPGPCPFAGWGPPPIGDARRGIFPVGPEIVPPRRPIHPALMPSGAYEDLTVRGPGSNFAALMPAGASTGPPHGWTTSDGWSETGGIAPSGASVCPSGHRVGMNRGQVIGSGPSDAPTRITNGTL
jgi:hypothetical protein